MIIVSERAGRRAESITADQAALVRPWDSFCRDRRARRVAVYVDFSRNFLVRSASTLEVLTSSETFQDAMKLADSISARLENTRQHRLSL